MALLYLSWKNRVCGRSEEQRISRIKRIGYFTTGHFLQQGSETRFLAEECGFFAPQRVSKAPSCPFKQVKNLVSSKVSGSKLAIKARRAVK
jgi:hypothetical protein